jgi:hypothetical protein
MANGLPWVEIDTNMPRHPKSIALGVALGDERAWTHVVELILHCGSVNASGKFVGKYAKAALERAAGWRGQPGAFAEAAFDVGFVDENIDGDIVVHGWEERATAHVAKRERDAERQRIRRERIAKRYGDKRTVAPAPPQVSADDAEDSEATPRDVTRMSRGRAPDVAASHGVTVTGTPTGTETVTLKAAAEAPPAADPVRAIGATPIRVDAKPERREHPRRRRSDVAPPSAEALAFFEGFQDRRLKAFPGALREPVPDAQSLDGFAEEVRAELGHDETGRKRLAGAVGAFLGDAFARNRKPSCPWSLFAKQWRRHVPDQDAAPPIPDKLCAVCELEPARCGIQGAGLVCDGCALDWMGSPECSRAPTEGWEEAGSAWFERRRAELAQPTQTRAMPPEDNSRHV